MLHKNSKERFFVYAGYIFLSKHEKDDALIAYRRAAKILQDGTTKEIKAFGTRGENKRYLLSQLSYCESFSCTVDKKLLYTSIMDNRKSIHRFKDYCIKRAAKAKLSELINRGLIKSNKPTYLRFFIDKQHTSTDGTYNLRESMREEFLNGIANFDYGIKLPSLFSSRLRIDTDFCDSKTHYLIQASDILANAIFAQHNFSPKLSPKIEHHLKITFPHEFCYISEICGIIELQSVLDRTV